MSKAETKLKKFLIAHIKGLKAIYLFGSRVGGAQTQESDYDIAFFADKIQSTQGCYELAQELANVLGNDVDLIDLRNATTVLRSQVLTKGERLYSDDSEETVSFEDFVFSDYARLNEERAEILKDIVRRGQIYGR